MRLHTVARRRKKKAMDEEMNSSSHTNHRPSYFNVKHHAGHMQKKNKKQKHAISKKHRSDISGRVPDNFVSFSMFEMRVKRRRVPAGKLSVVINYFSRYFIFQCTCNIPSPALSATAGNEMNKKQEQLIRFVLDE